MDHVFMWVCQRKAMWLHKDVDVDSQQLIHKILLHVDRRTLRGYAPNVGASHQATVAPERHSEFVVVADDRPEGAQLGNDRHQVKAIEGKCEAVNGQLLIIHDKQGPGTDTPAHDVILVGHCDCQPHCWCNL